MCDMNIKRISISTLPGLLGKLNNLHKGRQTVPGPGQSHNKYQLLELCARCMAGPAEQW